MQAGFFDYLGWTVRIRKLLFL